MKKGFTLIEVLVVVLIIGILTSVALPQYQKAVEKSKVAKVMPLLRSVVTAQETYYSTFNRYAETFDDLDISLPADFSGNTKWDTTSGVTDTRSNGEWSLQLYDSGTFFRGVYLGRISGPYQGAGFEFIFENTSGRKTDEILCAERFGAGLVLSGKAGRYCENIFHATSDGIASQVKTYNMP